MDSKDNVHDLIKRVSRGQSQYLMHPKTSDNRRGNNET